MEKKKIGDFFVEKKVLTHEQKNRVLEYAAQNGKSFGEAGLELGVLSRDDMVKVFGPNFEIDFFYLDPRYYPEVTKSVLSLDEILRFGALPLGYKKKSGFLAKHKYLNVGLLNPANETAVNELKALLLERLASDHVTGINIFLVLSDQYLDVLSTVYKTDETSVRNRAPTLDSTLLLHLGG